MTAVLFAAKQFAAKVADKKIAQAFKKPCQLALIRKLAVAVTVAKLIFINYYFYNIRCFKHKGSVTIFGINGINYLQETIHAVQIKLLFDLKQLNKSQCFSMCS